MSDLQEVVVPEVGVDSVEVIELLVSVGDAVTEEQGLVTVESEKATMDIPSPINGTVRELKVKEGDTLGEGELILLMEAEGAAKLTALEKTVESVKAETPKQTETSATKNSSAQRLDSRKESATKPPPVEDYSGGERHVHVYSTPSVRRIAREYGVDLSKVKGTGRKGRILAEDVQAYVKHQLSKIQEGNLGTVHAGGGLHVIPLPKVDFAKFGDVEKKPLSKIQRISGPSLHRNWVTIPHVTQFGEADISELETFRKEQNEVGTKKGKVKLTPLVFIMKAVAKVLLEFPQFNASLDEDGAHVIFKKYIHIGFAVDTPNGLVVPVIRDVNKKGLFDLTEELARVSEAARSGKLALDAMQGGCFSISSLGGIGGTQFTPIINAPEVAILGVSRTYNKPLWDGEKFVPSLTLPLALSYDHRVIDGADGARFITVLSDMLTDIRKLIL